VYVRGEQKYERRRRAEQEKNCQNVSAAIFVQLIGLCLPALSNALLLSLIWFGFPKGK